MKLFRLLVILVLASAALGGCDLINPADWYGPQLLSSAEHLNADDLPKNFNWGNKDGKNYLTRIHNQKIPIYCGSCWAESATATISDRISIMRGAAFPEIVISPQVLLNCDYGNSGCRGGSHVTVLEYVKQHFVTDESCSPFVGRDYNEGQVCDDQAFCKDCDATGKCWAPASYDKYTVLSYGNIRSGDVTGIMKEIYQNGPMICSINHKPIDNYFNYTDVYASNDKGGITHAVELVGWGETEQGTPYWIMKNSFGEEWGDRGYIKIFRGNNTIHIEEACTWVTIKNTWGDQKYPHAEFGKAATFVKEESKKLSRTLSQASESDEEVVNLKQTPIPDNLFYGDINGMNFLTRVMNQNLPQYCDSGWAHAVSSSISDRINFRMTKNLPKVTLSVQPLLNCGAAGGSCKGGDLKTTLEFISKHGIAEVGCQTYEAYAPVLNQCTDLQQCMMCRWQGDHITTCAGIPYKQWFVSSFGKLSGTDAIKLEVVTRGPVACTIEVTEGLKKYKGGVYSEAGSGKPAAARHGVVIVGYGTDEKTKQQYWIVRNSWGSHYGESGYFRILMGSNNLSLESNCWFAEPSTQPVASV